MQARSIPSFLTAAAVILAVAVGSALAQEHYRGKKFRNFTATNAATGEKFSLEDLRGKIVVLDFWATWCGPCIKELPNVKKAYAKMHEQGVEIVSISLDSDIQKCKRFIKSENMDWYHVIEGGGWGTRLAKEYGVNSIPRMLVLNTEGVVVADNTINYSSFNIAKEIEKAIEKTPPELGPAGEARAKQELEKAEVLIASKDYVAAMKKLESIVKKYAKTESGPKATARIEELKADPKVSAAIEKARLVEANKKAQNMLKMADMLAKNGRYDAAKKNYERLIERYPKTEAAEAAKLKISELP